MNPEPAGEVKKNGLWQTLREWLFVIVSAIIISIPIRYFIAEPFIVNGASMDPTFATGQFLIVDRLSYRFEEPKRGDVIVFQYPNNPSTYYIKRIIGLPGESLHIKDGHVTIASSTLHEEINLDEPYISSSHLSKDYLDVTLTDTEYFVMGDNRTQSYDSRVWGPLDRDLIVGRPIVRLFPITSLSILPGK
ncbi:MAG: signal peptidase I [Candidatus Paceibacterota bacterium]|jgi:signal peptidase I